MPSRRISFKSQQEGEENIQTRGGGKCDFSDDQLWVSEGPGKAFKGGEEKIGLERMIYTAVWESKPSN